jgi:hypothetical protein
MECDSHCPWRKVCSLLLRRGRAPGLRLAPIPTQASRRAAHARIKIDDHIRRDARQRFPRRETGSSLDRLTLRFRHRF